MTINHTTTIERFTLQEVSDWTRTRPSTLSRWIREGKLAATRVGRKWLVTRSAVEQLLSQDQK